MNSKNCFNKPILFSVVLILTTQIIFAQLPDFPADRPGLSDAPDLIDKHTWQIATGFDISKYNHYGVYQLSQNTLKYGINNFLEARLDFAYQYNPQNSISGVAPPSIGLKTLLF